MKTSLGWWDAGDDMATFTHTLHGIPLGLQKFEEKSGDGFSPKGIALANLVD